jgi:cytochrome P450
VAAAHLDHETFSSAHGTVLELMTPDPYPPDLMIFMDPPAHTMLRVLVSRAFTPRRDGARPPRPRWWFLFSRSPR